MRPATITACEATTHVVGLPGCTPEPLINYLKALGVFRLVAEQVDPGVAASWEPGFLRLHTALDECRLVSFFLHEYRPTPVITPWNSASGFWGGTAATAALTALADSTHPRLAPYREAIRRARDYLARRAYTKKPKQDEKAQVLQGMRNLLPDEAALWIDAVCALLDDGPVYAPILGTGGNDGRLEFSVNFVQRLADVIPLHEEPNPPTESAKRGKRRRHPLHYRDKWLRSSLFGEPGTDLVKAAVGQFHPGGVGGPNATQDFEGGSLVNPWDFVLAIEGALMLAGSVSRRHGRESTTALASFPFTVRPSPAGWETIVHADTSAPRCYELWVPLWDRVATYAEVRHLMAEGRVQVGTRPATTGVDFGRAIASLGVDRGLSGFYRYGFVQRSGRAHIAAPLGRLQVAPRRDILLLDEVDPWLQRLQRWTRRKDVPNAVRVAHRRLEDAIFAYCQRGQARDLQEVLMAIAEMELAIASSKTGREQMGSPIHSLSLRWAAACDDRSQEFRLARAVSSMCPIARDVPGREDSATWAVGPARIYIEPIEMIRVKSKDQERYRFKWDANSPSCVWGPSSLEENLVALLRRRCLELRQSGASSPAPIRCAHPVSLNDVAAFLDHRTDDLRLKRLTVALSLLPWHSAKRDTETSHCSPARIRRERFQAADNNGFLAISRVYALCKILFHHTADVGLTAKRPGADRHGIPFDLSLLTRLSIGDITTAVDLAGKRLRSEGYTLLGTTGGRWPRRLRLHELEHQAIRIAAALAFPVEDIRPLVHMVVAQKIEEVEGGEETEER